MAEYTYTFNQSRTFGVEIECDVGNAFLLQYTRQILTATAIAANDHMLVGIDGAPRDAGHLERLLQPFATD